MRVLLNELPSSEELVHSIVRQRQLRLYGHVARYLEADPACRVVSLRDNPTWRRPRAVVPKLFHAKDPPDITSLSRGPPANQKLSLPAKIPITM